MARIAATMLLLSLVFWYVSSPPIRFGRDFPSCIAARVDTTSFAVGAISKDQLSTLFITRESLQPWKNYWQEQSYGHFCGFQIPTATYGVPVVSLLVRISPTTVGWDCPYWLMTALWGLVAAKYVRTIRFRVLDLFYWVTVVALVVAAVQSRHALPLVLLLNMATLWLALQLVISGIYSFWIAPNALWPLLVPVETLRETESESAL